MTHPSNWNLNLHLRTAGFLLQLFFIFVVFKDMYTVLQVLEIIPESLRENLEKQRSIIINWFKTISDIFKPMRYEGLIEVGLSSKVDIEKISTLPSLGKSSDGLKKRIELLEKRLLQFEVQTHNNINSFKNGLGSLGNRIADERENREAKLVKLYNLIKRISTGGFTLETVALFWLIIGLVLTIFPNEIVDIYGSS